MSIYCELCRPAEETLLYRDDFLRVILVYESDFTGFCRVIVNKHVQEMTDLSATEAARLMDWVLRTELALRQQLSPDKINLASLGNIVPHLHWHVIPRFSDDSHFPRPVWAEALRPAPPSRCSAEVLASALKQRLASAVPT